MPVHYPPGFDPEQTYVTLYRTAAGDVIAHGCTVEPPPVPEGATELTLEEYEAAVAENEAAHAALAAELAAADATRAAEVEAAALEDFAALEALGVGEASARRMSGYAGPWPVK